MITAAFLIGYLSLVIELVFFHVPSVANTQNFFLKNDHYNTSQNDLITKIQNWSTIRKILLLVVPMVLVQLYFLLPFLYFFPTINSKLLILFEANTVTNWIGILFITLGRLLTFGSMIYLRKQNKQTGDSFKLHTKGIFRWSRNPGLDGMFLFFAGFGLLFPTFWLWLGLIFYFYYMLFRVRIEEAFLQDQFKEEFNTYLKKTNRFLLFK